MKRALLILSLATLVVLGAVIVAQALIYTNGITYDPHGQPVHPTRLAVVTSAVAGYGAVLALALAALDFVFGIVVIGFSRRFGWLIAVIVAGILSYMGLFVMAWVLLSANSPIAAQTPFVLIPLVTLLYSLIPVRTSSAAPVAA
jgi:ABC-type multidrug transport system permease subunit